MDYVEQLRQLATTKKTGWQQSDCPVVRTSTIETQKAWDQVKKLVKESEAELYKKCELAIEAQARYRKEDRATGGHVAQPKMLSSWLRMGRWDEDIPSHAELKQKIEVNICSMPDCNSPVHGPKFELCDYHYCRGVPASPNGVSFYDLRANHLRRNKDEQQHDYIQRCIDHCRQKGFIR